MRLKTLLWLVVLMPLAWCEVKVTNVEVKPRWPWNGKVDVTYSIECDEVDDEGKPKDVYVDFTGIDHDRNREIKMKSLTGDGAEGAIKAGGPYTVIWDAAKDEPAINSSSFDVKIHTMAGLGLYMVVDLEKWSIRYSADGPNLNDDTCRTTELWLRKIMPGTYTMGSPSNELGRYSDETQHEVTITQMFYIGVFECTQKQWELVKNARPSYFNNASCYTIRPVERVSYDMIRGTGSTEGAGWPTYGHAVDASSFMGILQEKTGLKFDLPTEAEWEYACRAGTTTALNSGKDLTSTSSCPNMAEVGRYYYNRNDGKGGYSQHTKVGSYLPNAWGLYDMHGNVWEWCLDWYGSYPAAAATDPKGPNAGSYRVLRGGDWNSSASYCHSASRGSSPSYYSPYGVRVCCWPQVR